jgi:Ni/Co efflux regulator RcnB
MKRSLAIAMTLALTLAGAQSASAQPGRDNRNGQYNNGQYGDGGHDNGLHRGWRKGGRIAQEDWRRGRPVDYRAHHLRRPPRGYEWREVDGNYVMAAVAGGIIASLILGGR